MPVIQPTDDPALASSIPLLLRNEEERRYEIRLVDPMTGESVAGYVPIALGPQISIAHALSPDGKKLAVIESRGMSCEYYAGGRACRPSADVLHLVNLPALRVGSVHYPHALKSQLLPCKDQHAKHRDLLPVHGSLP